MLMNVCLVAMMDWRSLRRSDLLSDACSYALPLQAKASSPSSAKPLGRIRGTFVQGRRDSPNLSSLHLCQAFGVASGCEAFVVGVAWAKLVTAKHSN